MLEIRVFKVPQEHKAFRVLKVFKVPLVQDLLVEQVLKVLLDLLDQQVLKVHKVFRVLKVFKVPLVLRVLLERLVLPVLRVIRVFKVPLDQLQM